jgi:hypothetical protein
MGLGLSLALQTISRHEGVMHVESAGGGGTTVMIWLPASPASKARHKRQKDAECRSNPVAEDCPASPFEPGIPGAVARSMVDDGDIGG